MSPVRFCRLILPTLVLLLAASPPPLHAEVILQFFNNSWNEITDEMPEIAEAGYGALWLPPPQKASGDLSVGYDLWDPFDLGGETQRTGGRTRYGTEEELLRLIRTAHQFGIRVYFDNIMNHRAFDVPGYDENTPIDIYPGMLPEDFHLQVTEEGFFRSWPNTVNWGNTWEVQNLFLSSLVDIAHETPNSNFGPNQGDTHPKISFVRHPDNPEYYDYHPDHGLVGFDSPLLTTNTIAQNPDFFKEDVGGYLMRSVRWLMDKTRVDGLRLDAVKHVPAYFFGEMWAEDKDTSDAGYLGQAQVQFNRSRGFSDANHRDTVFDVNQPRDDAMMFGEHMGEPPPYTEYFASGMRLLDAKIHQTLNDRLGNPWSTLDGLQYPDYAANFQFGAHLGVPYAKSHDDNIAYREELHNALNLTREGLPDIYTDGNRQAETLGQSGGAFPRHANTAYLGQWGDDRIPNLVYIHNHFARGTQKPRWGDQDVVAYERLDKHENWDMTDGDGVTLFFVMNDNYDGGEYREIPTSFPDGAYLYQYASAGAHFYHTVTDGKIKVITPPGGYFAFSWRTPEESDLWKDLGGHPLTIYQNGEETGWISYERKDGPDGDPGFNPYGLPDDSQQDFAYTYYVPRVTQATNLRFVARVDGSAHNVRLKLGGGIPLNDQSHALGDPRDHPPAIARDSYLGYEQADFVKRIHREKFAARNTASNNVIGSAGAETYVATIGQSNFTYNTGATGKDSDEETADWIWHHPEFQTDESNDQFWPAPGDAANQDLYVWVKSGDAADINRMFLYYTTDGQSWPEGAAGEGLGSTRTVELYWSHADTNDPTADWWTGVIPGQPAGTELRYKIGGFNQQDGSGSAPWDVIFPSDESSVALKKTRMGVWDIDGFNADTIAYRPHNDYGLTSTGLVEGFHIIKARSYLQRDGAAEGNGQRSALYNTHKQVFYLDRHAPTGEVLFPEENDAIFDNQYEVVVRTDPTVKRVWFNIEDNEDANDDGQTGREHGNGTNELGATSWVPALQVNPNVTFDTEYPAEWRFTFHNVPTSGTAAIRVKLAEVSSSTNPALSDIDGHFTTLTRTIQANGPDADLFVGWPQNDGDTVGEGYVLKTYFSKPLWDEDETTIRNRFLLRINGQAQGKEDYDLNWQTEGEHHELAFTLPNLYNQDPEYQHEIEVWHTNAFGDGVTLYTKRYVKAAPSSRILVQITDPPEFDSDGNPFVIILPDVANPAPSNRQYRIQVETDQAAQDVRIAFTNSTGTANPVATTTNILSGTVSVSNGTEWVLGDGTAFTEEIADGQDLTIGGHEVTVANVLNNNQLRLTAGYPGATATGLTAMRIDGFPARSGNKKYWNFLWTNITEGRFSFVARVDTNGDPSTVEAEAWRNTRVIFRDMVNSSTNDLDDDDDGLYDSMETNPTNLPSTNPETWNNGDVHIWQIYGRSDPLLPDSDADGLPDGLELGWRHPIDPAMTDTNADTNGDGDPNFAGDYDPPYYNTVPDNYDVPNYDFNGSRTELIAGSMTDPTNPDSDYDGLPDGLEDANRNGWVDGDGAALAPGQDTSTRTAWPDGEMQNWETWTETDPNNNDTDGDGAMDGYGEDTNADGGIDGDANSNRTWEAGETWSETDPLNPDTDGDGLPDGWEQQYGFDPLNDGVIGHTSMRDGSSISTNLHGASGNPDGDVIVQGGITNEYTNIREFQNGTNPWIPDDGEPPPPDAIRIGPGDPIGAINGVTNYQQFTDWRAEDVIVHDEYEGVGGNYQNGDVYPGYTGDGVDGYDTSRDIVSFYARDGGDSDGTFYFRVDFYDLQVLAEEGFLDLYVVIDTGQPEFGEMTLPDEVDTLTEMRWEAVVAVYQSSQGRVYVDTDPDNNTTAFGQALDGSVGVEARDQNTPNGFIDAYFNAELDAVEFAISRQALLDAGWSGLNADNLNFQVFVTKDGTGNSSGEDGSPGPGDIGGRTDIRDTIYDDGLAEDYYESQAGISSTLTSWFSGSDRGGRAKLSLLVHGNQAIQPAGIMQGLINNDQGAGYYRVLESHELFDRPLNLHITPSFASAIEWAEVDPAAGKPWLDGPAFNDRITRMAQTNQLALLAGTFSDHMMPYFSTDYNVDNERLANRFLETIYEVPITTNAVFWTPERLLDADVLQKIGAMGYRSTVIDQMEHMREWFGREAAYGTRGYQINRIEGIDCFVINNGASDFRFEVFDGGLNMPLRRLFNRKAREDRDQLVTIFSNWEDFIERDKADAYDRNLRWIANHPWIEVVTLEDVLNRRIDLDGDGNDGDWWYVEDRGSIPDKAKLSHDYINYASQGDYDEWYLGSDQEEGLHDRIFEHRPGLPVSTNYGMLYSGGIVSQAWASVRSVASSNLADLARAVLHASTFETAFHQQWELDLSKFSTGDYINPDETTNRMAGFALHAQSQTRKAGLFSRLDQWASSADGLTGAAAEYADVDMDGEDEYLLYNRVLFALFERVGGRMTGAWARDPADGHIVQMIGNFVNNPGSETEYEGASNVDSNGTIQAFRTSAFKDWWVDTDEYVNAVYTFTAETNGWTIQSPDGAITKTITLPPRSGRLEAAYTVGGSRAGRPLYIRHGLSPHLMSLLLHGQRYLSDEHHAGGAMILTNAAPDRTACVRVRYAGSGYTAGFNHAAVDDNPGEGVEFMTRNMRNQAHTHQVELVGTNSFTFALDLESGSMMWDSDSDKLPDDWETNYFGTIHITEGSGDQDGDGAGDWEEYVAGSNPMDEGDLFHLTSQHQDGGIEVHFPTASNRSYVIWYTDDDLAGPDWTAINPGAPIPGNGQWQTWLDDGSQTTPHPSAAARRFYNIQVTLDSP